MKGYVFTLDKKAEPSKVMAGGRFVVRQRPTKGRWTAPQLATFADFAALRPGDVVFFFQKRRVYGIGRVRKVPAQPDVGAWWLWRDAAAATSTRLGQPGRVVVMFEPHPVYYDLGIDMDELLGDARAASTWALRFFWKRSFIQMDDDETRALMAAFVRRFPEQGPSRRGGPAIALRGFRPFSMADLVRHNPSFYDKPDGRLTSENVLHGLLIERLSREPWLLAPDEAPRPKNAAIFHEVPASPPKPADYADRIDVLRVRTRGRAAEGLPHAWDVIECKAKTFDALGPAESVLGQLMKYVEFCAREKAARNYGAVRGHYVAHLRRSARFKRQFETLRKDGALSRTYVLDPHETRPLRSWDGILLWGYSWNHRLGRLDLIPLQHDADARI